jgi:DNA-binding sugar fermentation-stimulating protein
MSINEAPIEATFVKRPSKTCKSPYMADMIVNDLEQYVHCPSLGCSGLVGPDYTPLVVPKNNPKAKSKYSVDFVKDSAGRTIGVNPMYANTIAENLVKKNMLDFLPIFEKVKREVTVKEHDSKFDLMGKIGNETHYIEIKNVPIAIAKNVDKKEQKKLNIEDFDDNKKVAIFPEGHRTKKTESMSPRACKHVSHLGELSLEENTMCHLIFIVQRQDCETFEPYCEDPIYSEILRTAVSKGLNVKALQVSWEGNNLYLDKELKVIL